MVYLIQIAEGTYRPGVNNIGDVLRVGEGPALPSGPGYEGFKITVLEGVTKAEVEASLNSLLPKTKRVWRTQTGVGEWTDEPPEEKEVWNDNGTWKAVEKSPKYPFNLSLDEYDTSVLQSKEADSATKVSQLYLKAKVNLKEAVENQTTLEIAKAQVVAEK